MANNRETTNALIVVVFISALINVYISNVFYEITSVGGKTSINFALWFLLAPFVYSIYHLYFLSYWNKTIEIGEVVIGNHKTHKKVVFLLFLCVIDAVLILPNFCVVILAISFFLSINAEKFWSVLNMETLFVSICILIPIGYTYSKYRYLNKKHKIITFIK